MEKSETIKNIRLTIAYDGTKYNGWQKQGNTTNTIQERLEETISRYVGEEIELAGSGRTDAGVHALGQVANFKLSKEASERFAEQFGSETNGFRDQINEYLPKDIRILEAVEADFRFHARLNAKGKHYSYRIDEGEVARLFDRKYVTRMETPLDQEAMERAKEYMLGEHDFKSFCDNRKMKKSTVRRVQQIRFTKNEGILKIDFYGNGFLYHMIRIMTGTLIEVGRHERKPEEMKAILEAADRSKAGHLAPATGLFLEEVFYDSRRIKE